MKTRLLKRLRNEAAFIHGYYRICPVCGKMWHKADLLYVRSGMATPCCDGLAYPVTQNEYILRRVLELKTDKNKGKMKSKRAKEYMDSLSPEVFPKRIGRPQAIRVGELAEEDAEERIRVKAIKVFREIGYKNAPSQDDHEYWNSFQRNLREFIYKMYLE